MIRFEDKEDYLEIDLVNREEADPPPKGDAYISIRVSSAGFMGQNDLWVHSSSLSPFCKSLIELENNRIGLAEIESMSPSELHIKIKNVDSAGHMIVEGKTGYRVQRENTSVYHSVEFGFEFDPSQLQRAVRRRWVKENAEQAFAARRL